MKERQMMLAKAVVNSLKQQTLRRQMIGNIEYQVYPCVMLVEGVHHGVGSDPVYYSQAVLEASTAAWNNMPVTVGHPVLSDGTHVLCNHDGTIRQQFQVGHIANVRFEDGKLKADIWINTALANRLSPALLQFIENGGNLEVSTGLLALDDGIAGQWGDEPFSASIIDMIPDHLALLPNSTGACSWSDGCGVRVNAAEKEKDIPELYVNSQDLMALSDKIRGYVDSMDVWDRTNDRMVIINFLRAIYSDYFVYKQKVRRPNQQETEQLLKQEYAVGEDGELTFSSGPIEVIEEVQYKPKANVHATTIVNKKGEAMPAQGTKCKDATTPADKKKCAEMMVNALISNEKTAFVEDDRPWLTAMNSAQLEKLVANMGPEEEIIVNKEYKSPETATATPTPVTKTPATDLVGFLNSAPPEIRALLNSGLRELDSKRATIIGKITANERNKFTKEALAEMDLAVLESIAALLPQPAPAPDYSGMNPAQTVINQGDGEEAYVPTTLGGAFAKK